MLEGMGHARSPLQRPVQRSRGAAAPGATGRPAAAAGLTAHLVLPRLAATVPRSITPRRLAAANARIARFLLAANTVRARDIPPHWRDELAVCEGALDAWVKREIGVLHCLSPQFVLQPLHATARTPGPEAEVSYGHVQIVWYERGAQQWPVGAAIERLERSVAGLGALALSLIEAQSRFAYPVFTPRLCAEAASILYWYGEEDEAVALEEACGDDAQARAEMVAQMVTRGGLAQAFPPWALDREACVLDPALLPSIAATGEEPFVREAARLLMELRTLTVGDEFTPPMDGEFIGFGALLSWRCDDVTVRVYDDLVNMAQEGECCEWIGEVEFDLDAPEALARWQRRMGRHFAVIRLLDALIHHLGEAD